MHDHAQVCPVLFGGQSIVNTTGQQITAAGTPLNNLHAALLEAFGIAGTFSNNGAAFGDYGNGPLAGVSAG